MEILHVHDLPDINIYPNNELLCCRRKAAEGVGISSSNPKSRGVRYIWPKPKLWRQHQDDEIGPGYM